MDYKYIIYALLAVAVIIGIIFKDKIKVKFFGLTMDAQNTNRRNKANIEGENNDVEQGSNPKGAAPNNRADVRGSGNKVKQS